MEAAAERSSMPKSTLFSSAHLLFHFISPFIVFSALSLFPLAASDDAKTLIALKSSIDPTSSLPWRPDIDVCGWKGIRKCSGSGKVTKLVLEYLGLNGTLPEKGLNRLDQLRVLSLKGNSISGGIPDLSGSLNLKALYLGGNRLSGNIPASLSALHRLKIVVLAGNRLSGAIPAAVVHLRRLYVLFLEDNRFSGEVPPLNQSSLRFFNVSNNRLSGKIPPTRVLMRFNQSSFAHNFGLCGVQIRTPCVGGSPSSLPPASPARSISPPPRRPAPSVSHHSRTKLIAGSVGGFASLVICLVLAWLARRGGMGGAREEKPAPAPAVSSVEEERAPVGDEGRKPEGLTWEGEGEGEEGMGRLVFCGAGEGMRYGMEELLRAAAESLGRGSVGSTYKAVMESGYIVTVKRLREAGWPRLGEFRLHMAVLGRLAHPNLVPLRAYFHSTEERLLVYDYFPNGSLFSLIHGSRSVSGGGKPLHWTSCLKIAEDVAAGLAYIHRNPGLAHGNVKSSNVLLGADFESCLTDYALAALRSPDAAHPLDPAPASLFYRAPELRRDPRRLPSAKEADVYSFGVLLLELLTGRAPSRDLVQEHGSDLPRWVRSVRDEEGGSSGDDPSSGNEAAAASQEKLAALVAIAVACVAVTAEDRPAMRDVLKMIRSARAEAAHASSNGSDLSPGRWSDTIQSFPRSEVLSI